MIIHNIRVRELLTYLYIPYGLLSRIFLKCFNCLDCIHSRYLIDSGKIEIDQHFEFHALKYNPIKLNIKDVKNKKVRRTLYLSQIFKHWNIYYIKTLDNKMHHSDNNRDLIYITKDVISIDDVISYYRINDYYIDKKYKSYIDDELYKIEPQTYAICTKKSYLHELAQNERKNIRNNKMNNHLNKLTKIALIKKDYFEKVKVCGTYKTQPLFFHLVEQDKYVLIKHIFNTLTNEEKEELINKKNYNDYKYINSLDIVKKNTETSKLLDKYKDLSIYDRYFKLKKITN